MQTWSADGKGELMSAVFASEIETPRELEGDDIFQTLLREYERVVVTSLVTSFGLELLVSEASDVTGSERLAFDRHGGDVDTVHNVRQMGIDPKMGYKNPANEVAYEARGAYDPKRYHPQSGSNYATIKHEAREAARDSGKGVEDAYTGGTVWFTKAKGHPEAKAELDHVLSAKWIHDDRGRVLAGMDGTELSDDPSNYRFTNKSLNASMGARDIPDWLAEHADEVTDEQRDRMIGAYEEARTRYDASVAAYYTSPAFAKDLGRAAGRQSAMMAARQVCGLVLAEVWFAVKRRLEETRPGFDPAGLAKSLAQGTKEGFANAKDKYRELLSAAADGALAGALASVTNTLANIFMTTSRSMGKVIRESYASLVDAARVLIVNPDGYLFGERLRAAAKVVATGASVVLGTAVMDAVARTPIVSIPYVGEAVQSFCGALVTGSLSCTLLLYLDRSEWANRLVACLNNVPTVELRVEQMRLEVEALTRYAAELAAIDYDALEREIAAVEDAVSGISAASSPEELNKALRSAASAIGVSIPWEGDFADFMEDPTSRLHFS